VAWARPRERQEGALRPVKIRVVAEDRQGALARITAAISEESTNIKTVEASVSEDRKGTVDLVLDITDTRHLERVLKRLRAMDGIRDAVRVVG
jgi:GTP pyrophosphokinase